MWGGLPTPLGSLREKGSFLRLVGCPPKPPKIDGEGTSYKLLINNDLCVSYAQFYLCISAQFYLCIRNVSYAQKICKMYFEICKMHFEMCILIIYFVPISTSTKLLSFMKHEKTVLDPITGEPKELNDNFVQFYLDNMDLIISINKHNSTAGTLFLWLVKHMDETNALVASQQAICEALGIHRNTVTNAANYLKQVKALDIKKTGTTNVYMINTEIAWKDSADKKQYAHFSAKVYMTKSEQSQFKTELRGHAVKKKPSTRKRQTQLDNIAGIGGSAAMLSISVCSLLQAISSL